MLLCPLGITVTPEWVGHSTELQQGVLPRWWSESEVHAGKEMAAGLVVQRELHRTGCRQSCCTAPLSCAQVRAGVGALMHPPGIHRRTAGMTEVWTLMF